MSHEQRRQPGGVDIPTAAAALGISPAAVRKRIRRGTLPAWKVDGTHWRVATPGTRLSREPGYDARDSPAALDAYRQLAETLQTENAFLRGLVADQQATIGRLTGGGALSAGPPAAPEHMRASANGAGDGSHPPAPSLVVRETRAWWQFWRRV